MPTRSARPAHEFMDIAVITEYNPFHPGHAEQIDKARALGAETITAFMSGNVVQRGDFAVYGKHQRADSAIAEGADLVISLPTPITLAPAKDFATGAIKLITSLGIHTHLIFGAETGNLSTLQKAANFIPDTSEAAPNKSYPALLQSQMADAGIDISLTSNNILAIEYLKAIKATTLTPLLIPRTSLYSAHAERERIYAQKQLPSGVFNPALIETAAFLKLKTATDWSDLPYLEEGLSNRLQQSAKTASSVDDFLQKAKCKRFTMARLKRILMCLLLDITPAGKHLPLYAHVLAYNKKGQKLLAKARKTTAIPISPNFERLAKHSPKLAEIERTANLWFNAGLIQ